MFKRRDIPPVLLLLLLIVLVMLTLSQILVVHNGRYGGRTVHNMRKLQLELREMDINLHSLMLQNVPSIELNRRLLQNQINAERIAAIIRQAAEPQSTTTKGTAFLDEGQGLVQKHEQDDGRALRLQGSLQLTSPSQLATTDAEFLARKAEALQQSKPTKPAQLIAQQSLQSRTQQDADDKRTKPAGEAAKTSVSEQFGLGNSSVMHYWTPSNTTDSPATDGAHKQSHAHNAPGTFHLQRRNNLDSSSHPQQSANNTAVEQLDSAASNLRHSSPRLNNTQQPAIKPEQTPRKPSATQKTEQMSQSTKVPVEAGVRTLAYCPSIPPSLQGNLHVNLERENYTELDIIAANPELLAGGMWRPKHCMARHKVAVIIPYRDREEHLSLLLYHLHPMLRKQQLDYTVIVVEQFGADTFNKARIMNIAFVEALKLYGYQCFVFHDVDLIPEDDRNMYSCPPQPRHMSVAIDSMGYKLAYPELVGGVLNMKTEHFQRVNGYSNLYWGWGAEDDDMAYRIMHVGLKITRPVDAVARYKMAKHTKRKPADWRKRAKLLYTGTRRFQFDGLNSLQYKVVSVTRRPLFTHILVDIGKPPRGF